ncbi:MAG: YceI family protein [Alphaproteobacteria bacterium]|jgi:polyisoprenoid-binding protein YceI|nr:YceI family protein [Alphaproteobacteria bacterium]
MLHRKGFLLLILTALPLLGGIAAARAAEYVIDPAHASIHFKASHFHFSKVQGRFNRISGGFTFDPAKAEDSKVHVVVDVGSIDTNHEARDAHMREPEYFNVARFPEAVFRSTRIVVTGARTGLMTGELSILGATIPVTLEVVFNGIAPHPLGDRFAKYNGITVASFSARTTISRSSFGMTAGRGEKGETVELSIEVEGWHKP